MCGSCSLMPVTMPSFPAKVWMRLVLNTSTLGTSNMIHRIDLLDVPRVDVFKTKRIQTFAGKLGIVTGISEQLPHIGNALPDHAPNLAVQRISSQAFPENAAEKILLVQRRGHERRGNRACIVKQVHLLWTQITVSISTCAGADRNKKHLLVAGWPKQTIRLARRHQEKLKRWVVIHCYCAVHEDEVAADADNLWRKISRRRSASAHQLPEWQLEIAVGTSGIVIFRFWIIGQRPW